ncbi:MAG: hypothetical protein COX51_09385 [Syntrophobacteraceae bacterium CG23_combo_of_CG06-09_8_20_14_all_50_8]|nr:MAG: hypothetical protein COX51_09385 [Syntrophobacteraceae bacterium CG23_combo_of_CG06-09_8_20_14_all_50_8]
MKKLDSRFHGNDRRWGFQTFYEFINIESTKIKLILLVSVMSFSGCNLQNSLLYYPESSMPSDQELAANNIQFWPSGQTDYRGFIGATEIRDIKGTVIVFHGNAGTAADRVDYVTALGLLGYRVILAEYPGYGLREGKLGEVSFVNDAQVTVRLASEKYEGPIIWLVQACSLNHLLMFWFNLQD